MSKHDPPIILAKVDANDDLNKELATEYEVKGFPTLKILRNGGKTIQEYKGPRDADGIVEYLKKQAGPASYEIKSLQDAGNLIDDKKIFVVSAPFLPSPCSPFFQKGFQRCLYGSNVTELPLGGGFSRVVRRRISKLYNVS